MGFQILWQDVREGALYLLIIHLKFIINKCFFLQKDYMPILESLENRDKQKEEKNYQ